MISNNLCKGPHKNHPFYAPNKIVLSNNFQSKQYQIPLKCKYFHNLFSLNQPCQRVKAGGSPEWKLLSVELEKQKLHSCFQA